MALQPGMRFGRYELVSRLGQGGMAETWLARLQGEAGFSKAAVLKKVLPEYSDDYGFTSMLISEARISATLSHDHLAQVFDFGRVDNEYFIAMEYVDGHPLHAILHHTRQSGGMALPIPPVAFIGVAICRGLHYAHTRKDANGKPLGIVHRDLSPENVLVSYEGQVKIVDFGLAKARELSVQATEPGVVKGKYLFFSPEQARCEEVDARTDVWATGITLYEMLCGKLPVEGPEFVVLPRIGRGEFPRPRELNPKVPQELDDILMGALAVRREDRYPSSQAFGDALAGFLYTAAPRFSSVTLSHFVQHLYRETMVLEGREVQVPESFEEELASWSEEPRDSEPEEETVPLPEARRAPPPPAPESPRPPQPQVAPAAARPSLSGWKWSVAIGSAVGWLAVGLLLVFLKRSAQESAAAQAEQAEEKAPQAAGGVVLRTSKPTADPADSERFLQQASQALTSHRYQAAVDNYRAALKVAPHSVDAKEGLGFALVLGNTGEESNEQAVKLLQAVVKEDILRARAWFSLGMALQELQRDNEAIEAYQKYLLLEPSGRFASDARIALKRLTGD
jgi:eukaryotic-like serine/threonine-protein kinase